MSAVADLERGRRAYEQRAWSTAYESLSAADEGEALGAEDLELLAVAAYMLGRVDEFLAALERAHHVYARLGEPLRAARAAVYVGINLAILGDVAQAGGWLARAQRLVQREGRECAERGYLLVPVAVRHEAAGDYAVAAEAAAEAAALGERFGDRDLFALGAHAQGHALIKLGHFEEGFRLLDEAMLAAIGGELSPIITGVVYCGAIAGCEEAYEPHPRTSGRARWRAGGTDSRRWSRSPAAVLLTGRRSCSCTATGSRRWRRRGGRGSGASGR